MAADDRRLGQGEEVVVPLEIAGPVGEPLAPVVPLTQLVALDHRPHGPIQHQDPPREERLELASRDSRVRPRTVLDRGRTVVTEELRKRKNPEAKTPQGERFSGLFNVAAISANRHGIGC